MRKHSTSQLCCLCCLCAKAQKAGICLGVVVGGVSIYPQSLQKKTSPKWAKNQLRLKAPSQRSPSHLEQSEELLCDRSIGRSVDLKSHAFPISPLTMSGTKIMHLSGLSWTVDYLEFMVLTTWSKTTLWQLQATCLTRLVAEVASKNCIQWMSSLIELQEDSLCLRINQLNINVFVLCFYAVFCQSVQQDSPFEWSILIVAKGSGTISNFGIRILFKTLRVLSRNALRSLHPESCRYSSWWDVVDAKGEQNREFILHWKLFHSHFKIHSFWTSSTLPNCLRLLIDLQHPVQILHHYRNDTPPALAMNHNERHHPDQIFWM